MKLFVVSLIGFVLSVSVGAESLLEGQVRLPSGQPVVGVQVRLFDLTDLRRSVGTTTDAAGYFALSLQTLSGGTALPTDFALGQNYPNPFNPSTIIPYQLPAAGHVRLEVFNVLGQRLATLVDAERSAGVHTAQWDATDAVGRAVGAGVYIYRLSSGGMTESQRMVLVDGQAGVPTVAVAQGPVRAEEGGVEADDRVYGLTVSGEGLVAYVNPAFRVGVDAADIVVEEHGGNPRMKLTTDRILGDVNNDGQVDAFDALYVLLYSEDSSVALPNNGDISLGDVNGDGQVGLADALLLAKYSVDPSDPSLPPGIGQAAPDLVSSVNGTPVGQDTVLSHIYWTDWDTDNIQRANLDGSNIKDLVAGLDSPGGLALDVDGGKIYWTDASPNVLGTGKIQRANLDGSNIETLITGLENPAGIALDVDGGKIYWTDVGREEIQRANLDGSNIETIVTEVRRPFDIALDVDRDKIYWTDGVTYNIQRANLDGSNIETLVTGLEYPFDIALDVDGGKIYWTDTGTDVPGTANIQCANLDGSNIRPFVPELDRPTGIALDVDGGKMYWTDWSTANIHRANLDGSSIEALITGLGAPFDIALDLDGGKIYWTDTGTDDRGTANIQRANLDGSNIRPLITGVVSLGIALDVDGGKIYWTGMGIDDPGTDKVSGGVYSANLDGSNIETLVTGLGFPLDIALDLDEGKIYWTDAGTDSRDTANIQRVNLDGSNIEALITGLEAPAGIALDVDEGKIYWTDTGTDAPGTGNIQRANLDGSNIEALITGLEAPAGIALELKLKALE